MPGARLTHGLGQKPSPINNERYYPFLLGAAVLVQPLAHFLAGLEERHGFLVDRDVGAGARVAAGAGRTMLDRKGPETAQFDAIAFGHRRGDLVEDRVDDVLDVALIEMRILSGDVLDQFRLDHRRRLQLDAGGCQSAKRPSRFSRSTVCTALQSSKRCASAFNPTASNIQAATCRNDKSLKRGSS